ncbi:MAG: restriction endonuclease [Candidatus Poribacteria bacterium]
MADDNNYREFQKPPWPISHDEQSLVVFLNWLLQPPKFRTFAYPFKQESLMTKEQWVASLLKPLPHRKFCDKLATYSPKDFERLVADFFRYLGYKVEIGEKGADGGIDLIIRISEGFYIVQCKRWKNKVGVTVVREVHSVSTKFLAKGAFIFTVSEFTDQALYYTDDLNLPVGLIDGKELFNLMSQIDPTAIDDVMRHE